MGVPAAMGDVTTAADPVCPLAAAVSPAFPGRSDRRAAAADLRRQRQHRVLTFARFRAGRRVGRRLRLGRRRDRRDRDARVDGDRRRHGARHGAPAESPQRRVADPAQDGKPPRMQDRAERARLNPGAFTVSPCRRTIFASARCSTATGDRLEHSREKLCPEIGPRLQRTPANSTGLNDPKRAQIGPNWAPRSDSQSGNPGSNPGSGASRTPCKSATFGSIFLCPEMCPERFPKVQRFRGWIDAGAPA
jgi:hypothetical protein